MKPKKVENFLLHSSAFIGDLIHHCLDVSVKCLPAPFVDITKG